MERVKCLQVPLDRAREHIELSIAQLVRDIENMASLGEVASPSGIDRTGVCGCTEGLVTFAAATLAARQIRAKGFPSDLFGEPAYDMMLQAYVSVTVGRTESVNSLCIASGVPQTTALRLVHHLVDKGIFVRRPDPDDRRRVFVEFSEDGLIKMEAMLRLQQGVFRQAR